MPPASHLALLRLFRSGALFALLTALNFGGLTTLANLYYQDGGNVLTMLLFRFAFATAGLLALARGHLRPPAGTVVVFVGLKAAATGKNSCVMGGAAFDFHRLCNG